jgi:hypothetical protein
MHNIKTCQKATHLCIFQNKITHCVKNMQTNLLDQQV